MDNYVCSPWEYEVSPVCEESFHPPLAPRAMGSLFKSNPHVRETRLSETFPSLDSTSPSTWDSPETAFDSAKSAKL